MNCQKDFDRFFILKTSTVDLNATLEGGQAFRWWRVTTEREVVFDGVIGDVAVRIKEIPSGLDVIIRAGTPPVDFRSIVADYLGLNVDLSQFRTQFSNDPCLGPAINGFPGLKLLRQNPWECLASFICSATSNIPRIKLNVDKLVQTLGTRIGPGLHDFAFPKYGVVADAGEGFIREIGWGFRAKYLVSVAEKLSSGDISLSDLRLVRYDEAKTALTGLYGVGEKIADCVLAFSLDKPEAFPIDRHIRRALEKWYGLNERVNNNQASTWARRRFGSFGALAQQYMFHRERLAHRAAEWGGTHKGMALPLDISVSAQSPKY